MSKYEPSFLRAQVYSSLENRLAHCMRNVLRTCRPSPRTQNRNPDGETGQEVVWSTLFDLTVLFFLAART